MKIWRKAFPASYISQDGIVILDDRDIPLPRGFISKPELRSTLIFPPHTRAGDHYHTKREELFIGFGSGMQIIFEDQKTKKAEVFDMDPAKNQGQCVAFLAPVGIPHAVRNTSGKPGFLIELATLPPEKIDYTVNI